MDVNIVKLERVLELIARFVIHVTRPEKNQSRLKNRETNIKVNFESISIVIKSPI